MSDAWEEIKALQTKRNSLREKLEKRKKEREGIFNLELAASFSEAKVKPVKSGKDGSPVPGLQSPSSQKEESQPEKVDEQQQLMKTDPEVESELLKHLCDVSLTLPVSSLTLAEDMRRVLSREVPEQTVVSFLQKFSTQQLISVKDGAKDSLLEVVNAENTKLLAMVNELSGKLKRRNSFEDGNRKKITERSRSNEDVKEEVKSQADSKQIDPADIMSLLSMPTIKEKETKKVGEEIMDLLSKPTAKERSLAERFRSQGGATVMEFCPHGTKLECVKNAKESCKKLHFKKIIQAHTDESLGDCSFLNTCFHMDTCKYVHYEVDGPKGVNRDLVRSEPGRVAQRSGTVLYPPQWIQCDLRYLDMSVLGKFAVIMADPPWDIHMELPYGTMSDDEMRQLGVPQLQDDGLIFLWVTGRAMELGRECLKLWGYDRVDEIIWVKTNQLQRIIRTGRTGHWLNHGKEHCLVGLKGDPPNLNRGLDCDVIVAEVRATSHKPDEIYGIIERLSPGTRKIELFGRPHNVQPNWITLGNQVDGVRLVDPQLIEAFRKAYPDGNCMIPPTKSIA